MGQKVHPIGFRVGISRGWDSLWFAEKNTYTKYLHEDLAIRKFLKNKLREAGISRIVIKRSEGSRTQIFVHADKPGIIYGRRQRGGLDPLRGELKRFTDSEVFLNVIEIRKSDLDSQLVAENIAQMLEKRTSFRRAMKKSVHQSMRAGAKGFKVMCSGRLGGAEMSRKEWFREGRVPLHTLRADIDYGFATAKTTYGIIGVKVWIYKGEAEMGEAPTPAHSSLP
jgi:small subunit ribosomal protein S3